jgi:hypothetical protein
VVLFATGWQKDLIKMRRSAHFVLKFLLRFFQKADGVWGGAPSVGIFFLELFLLCLLGSKEKAAKCAELIR